MSNSPEPHRFPRSYQCKYDLFTAAAISQDNPG